MDKTYVTSDWHFFHRNIIRLCDRPFSSVEEMNETMLENINSIASSDDTLPTVGEVEHFSVALDKDSPLTDCVNSAIAAMKADGTLQAITDEWITGAGAPELE